MTMLKNNFITDICVATFDGVVIIGTEGNPSNVNVIIPQASANRCYKDIFWQGVYLMRCFRIDHRVKMIFCVSRAIPQEEACK